MKFGLVLPNFGGQITAAGNVRISQAAEELGFDSVFATDHIIMPREARVIRQPHRANRAAFFYRIEDHANQVGHFSGGAPSEEPDTHGKTSSIPGCPFERASDSRFWSWMGPRRV